MNNEMLNIPRSSATNLNVLVVYDNLGAGIQAKYFCDRLAQRLAPRVELQLGLWNLSALQLPPLARAAEDEATQTDLLLIVVNGDEPLPPPIKNWISRCARRLRSNAGAVVAQLHGILRMNQELSPAYEWLKHFAVDAGLDFFSEVVEPAGEKLDDSIESIHGRSHMCSPVLAGILQVH
jgi:hypothetical protein